MSFVRITDTRIMQLDPRNADVAVKEGAKNVAYTPLVSASLSTSNCNFNLNNIGSNVCRSRRQCMRLSNIVFTVNLTTPAVGEIFTDLGFKSWPLNRIISNISHQINGASYSLNLNQIIDSITKFNLESEYANFFDNTAYDAVCDYKTAQGSSLNPIQPFAAVSTGTGIFKPRSKNIVVSTNTSVAGSQTITITITSLYEPLCSPFNNIGKNEDTSLYGINGEILQLQFVNDLFNNMLACGFSQTGTVINSVSVAFPSTATLECVYLTPNESFLNEIPRNSITHYNNYSVFSTNVGAVNAGNTTTISSQVCQFTGMPFKILVYVRQSDSTKAINIPDRYLKIVNVTSCNIDNGANQLSAASTDQLYELSSRNGCVLDRGVWLQENLNGALASQQITGCGSILALDPKIDLGVSENISDSSPGRFIFQITLNLLNNTPFDFAGTTLYVIGVNNAVLERRDTEYVNYLYNLPNNAIEMSKQASPIAHSEFLKAQNANMFLSGGSFKSFFSKVWNGLKKAGKWTWDHRDDIVKAVNTAAQIAKAVGLGEGETESRPEGGMTKYREEHMKHHGKHPKRRMDLFYQ